jgi:hypothetical protein
MTLLDLIGAVLAFTMAAIVLVKITLLHSTYNAAERIGLGFMGGPSMLLGLSLLEGPESPFRLWGFLIFMAGNLVYMVGRFMRQLRHYRANREMIERAERKFGRQQ